MLLTAAVRLAEVGMGAGTIEVVGLRDSPPVCAWSWWSLSTAFDMHLVIANAASEET